MLFETVLPLPRQFMLNALSKTVDRRKDDYEAQWLVKEGEEAEYEQPLVNLKHIETDKVSTLRAPFDGIITRLFEDSMQVFFTERVDVKQRRIELHLSERTGYKGRDLRRALKRQQGDFVEKGQTLVHSLKSTGMKLVRAPIAGVITKLDSSNGDVVIERKQELTPVESGIYGSVKRLSETEIELCGEGHYFEGMVGLGRLTWGELVVAARSTDFEITSAMLTEELKGKVVLAGAYTSLEVIKKAKEVGVRALVTANPDHIDISHLLGSDFSVGSTGEEDTPYTMVLLEGFGKQVLEQDFLDGLGALNGAHVVVSPRTHIRAGVIRPHLFLQPLQ
ncbi:MAG: hypothetical protein U5N86_11160 [Planctomycetota bacterium]|nr:hypothetical protein [Planctomycetota bacterium]